MASQDDQGMRKPPPGRRAMLPTGSLAMNLARPTTGRDRSVLALKSTGEHHILRSGSLVQQIDLSVDVSARTLVTARGGSRKVVPETCLADGPSADGAFQ